MLTALATTCAVGTVGACFAYGAPHLCKLVSMSTLRRTCRNRRTLVLSYDDGPGEATTPRMLDILGGEGAAATFFLLGRRAAATPELVDRIAGEGHELGCHTHDHLHAWKVTPAAAVRDIRRGYAALAPWVVPDAPFRPPYGKLTLWTWWELKRRGAPIAFWTIDSGDTWRVPPEPRSIAERVSCDGGGVVLLHDFDRSAERQAFVLRTTELLLATARREGLRISRLGDVMTRHGAEDIGEEPRSAAHGGRVSGAGGGISAKLGESSA